MSKANSISAKQAPLAEHVRNVLNLNPLPQSGYVRLSQLVGDLDADPPIPPIIPAGKSSIWSWVKAGRFPAPVKLGPRVTAWDVRSIRKFLDECAAVADEKGGSISDAATSAIRDATRVLIEEQQLASLNMELPGGNRAPPIPASTNLPSLMSLPTPRPRVTLGQKSKEGTQ